MWFQNIGEVNIHDRARAAALFRKDVTMKKSDETKEKDIPGKLEYYEGKLLEVKQPHRQGWWRFHEHYDRDGYCDNPARGY